MGLSVLVRHANLGYVIDLEDSGELLSRISRLHAPLGNGSEAAWAIWGSIFFHAKLDAAATKALAGVEDKSVALLAFDANLRGVLDAGKFSTASWEPMMAADRVQGDNWLVAYQATVKGCLPGVEGANHIAIPSEFNCLRSQGANFYCIDAKEETFKSDKEGGRRGGLRG